VSEIARAKMGSKTEIKRKLSGGIRIKSWRSLSLAVLLTGASFGAGVAAETVTMNGSWWRDTLDDRTRVYVAAALVDAYAAGWGAGSTSEGVRIQSESASFLSEANLAKLYDVIYRKNPDGTFAAFNKEPAFSRTFGFYSAGITDFYETHSDATVNVGNVIACLADNPQMSCDEVSKFK
jgi:hypothetical protein